MEKDYFLDRPTTVKFRKNLLEGTEVLVCTKESQSYAKEIKDLTLIKIKDNLTSTDEHPRGQKVIGYETLRDFTRNILLDEKGEIKTKEIVGR